MDNLSDTVLSEKMRLSSAKYHLYVLKIPTHKPIIHVLPEPYPKKQFLKTTTKESKEYILNILGCYLAIGKMKRERNDGKRELNKKKKQKKRGLAGTSEDRVP